MAHTQARRAVIALISIDVFLVAVTAVSGYLSGTSRWPAFWLVSALATALFAVTRVVQARPRLAELACLDDTAAQMARSALDYGVERFYNMQRREDQNARNADTGAAIRSASAMWLCANSGASYLDAGLYRHWPSVAARLAEGVPFKVVLLDPFSSEKGLRNRLNVGEDAEDSKLSVSNLIRLHNEFASLEIRMVRDGMHATVFGTPSCMFYDPYHAGVVGHRIENRSFCLRIRPAEPPHAHGYFGLFRRHFESLWRVSEDFEDWFDANAELLSSPGGSIRRRHRRTDDGRA